MKPAKLPLLKYLKECFVYDEHSGKLFWKKRPRRHFATNNAFAVWNSHCAGKEALYVDARGYGIVRLDGVNRKVHRVAWKLKTGKEPPPNIDHRDRNKINNRWKNMRAATNAQNNFNKASRTRNASGVTGILRRGQRWVAMASIDEVGIFDTLEQAVAARKKAVEIRYGEFAT